MAVGWQSWADGVTNSSPYLVFNQYHVWAGKGSEIGDYLTTHQAVDAISFTGGDTGIAISKKAGMVPIQMELGGKDACIVCADADLDLAAKHIIKVGWVLILCLFCATGIWFVSALSGLLASHGYPAAVGQL